MDDAEFRKRLKRTPGKPDSPRTGYVAAGAVSIVGVVSVLGAKSQPIFISGWLIIAGCIVLAVRTYLVNRRWNVR